MDLVADMLVEHLARSTRARSSRRSSVRRCARARRALPGAGAPRPSIASPTGCGTIRASPPALADRFDLFHIVDHSYAHLVHALPAGRTLVTCHDLDTFRSSSSPSDEPRSPPFRSMTRRILAGLRGRARGVRQRGDARCAGRAGRASADADVRGAERPASELLARCRAGGRRRSRAPARARGLASSCCTSAARSRASGSTCCSRLRRRCGSAHRRAAGARRRAVHRRAAALARELGIVDAIVVLPFARSRDARGGLPAQRAAAAAVRARRFGLPVVEALACGTPIVASDIPVLREVGGDAP